MLKLCEFCLQLPEYKWITLSDGLKKYGVRKSDVYSLPTIQGSSLVFEYEDTTDGKKFSYVPLIMHNSLLDFVSHHPPSFSSQDEMELEYAPLHRWGPSSGGVKLECLFSL